MATIRAKTWPFKFIYHTSFKRQTALYNFTRTLIWLWQNNEVIINDDIFDYHSFVQNFQLKIHVENGEKKPVMRLGPKPWTNALLRSDKNFEVIFIQDYLK